jgi:glycosyltransferase involved in cell wall biosynthesis
MNCPGLEQLPNPPRGKTGWPWNEQTPPLPSSMGDGQSWPRISIVTPSFNQGQFLEETIRSILLQGYPNLEYLIVDGGSTDDSVEIIRKYQEHLSFWVSEPDSGQSDAINKGFARCSGELMNWINSDDVLTPGALQVVAEAFGSEPDAGVFVGAAAHVNHRGRKFAERWPTLEQINQPIDWRKNYFFQPSAFFRRSIWEATGPLNQNLHYVMDVDFWIRAKQHCRFALIEQILSCAREHASAKTTSQQPAMFGELAWVQSQYGGADIIRRDMTEVYHNLRIVMDSRLYRFVRRMLPAKLWSALKRRLGVIE